MTGYLVFCGISSALVGLLSIPAFASAGTRNGITERRDDDLAIASGMLLFAITSPASLPVFVLAALGGSIAYLCYYAHKKITKFMEKT